MLQSRVPTRRSSWLVLLAILPMTALLACGGPEDDEVLDDDDAENEPELERHTMAACPSGGNTSPATPSFGASIDGYASYVGQSTCSGTAKPGVTAFKNLVLATYPCTSSGGIVRGCSVGGKSEHKEGRAWDWMIKYPHPAADALLSWLLATDSHGNKHANARRLGIMYMIWNRKMWRAYKPDQGWQPYTGSNPHTDHVHFSFSWNGANKKTSFWSAPAAPSTPTTPTTPSTPSTPAAPQMTIKTSILTISGQSRDFCQRDASKGIFDFNRGQSTSVYVEVKNTGGAVAKNVQVGIWTEEPYLKAVSWNIYTDWKAGAGFKINDTDGMQTIPHTNPGQSFTLNLAAISPDETKRIVLDVRADRASLGVVDHPDVRAWIAHVDSHYDKASFDSSFTNVGGLQTQNGGNLRHHSQLDVIDVETCDQLDNNCDGAVDEGGVCAAAPPSQPETPPSSPDPSAAPQADSGVWGQGWSDGMVQEPDPSAASGARPGHEVLGSCSMGHGPAGSPAGLLVVLLAGLLALARRR